LGLPCNPAVNLFPNPLIIVSILLDLFTENPRRAPNWPHEKKKATGRLFPRKVALWDKNYRLAQNKAVTERFGLPPTRRAAPQKGYCCKAILRQNSAKHPAGGSISLLCLLLPYNPNAGRTK
jgi:hypothetical protein